jgi:Flagellar biosynthesis protein, FliO
MTLKKRKHRLPLVGKSQPIVSLEPKPAPPKGSFHAVLSEWSIKPSKFALPLSLRVSELGRPGFSVLERAWSWVHTKYALTATKRMRVVETLPLGEKRFVALIRVEDREFLVGGGTSGVSLLAQLETVPDPVDALQRKSAMEGDPE